MTSLSPRDLWGWNVPARCLFLLGAACGAIGLLTAAPPRVGTIARAPTLRVDTNTVRPEILGALPRIGPTLVNAIVAERRITPYHSLDDLDRRVRRVGPATVAALRPYLRFEPAERSAAPP